MTDDSNALADELDARLANADAALAAAYPGDRGRRQPVHTVYVPADRYDAGTVRGWGRGGDARRWPRTAGSATELAEALDLRPSVAVGGLRAGTPQVGPEPVEDLRIDFEDGYGIRPDDEEDAAAVTAARCLAASIAAGARRAVPRDPGQELRGADAPPRACAHCELFIARAGRGRRPDRRLRGDAAQGDLGRAGRGDGVRALRAAGAGAWLLEPARCGSRSRWRHRRRSWAPTGRRSVARMIHAGGGRVHRPALRHLRLLRVARRRGRLPEPGASRSPTTPRRSCRWRPPAPACFVSRRLHQRAARGRPRGGAGGVARCTPAWSADRSSAAIYQGWDMHPAQLPSRYVATYSLLPRGAAAARPSGSAPTYTDRTVRRSLTSRRRPRRWPASCSAASSAARSTRPSLTSWSGSTRIRWPPLARRRPKA